MFVKLLKDESGVALALAVIMIVLVGVMGAGLLVFVRNDLEAVIEVNRGQRAFETTEAGVQAARRQLLSNATEEIYDSNTAENSDWAYVGGAGGSGKDLTFNGNTVNVKIQYLLPSTTTFQLNDPAYAPELVPADADPTGDYPEPKDYFKVIAEGTSGDARRKIEAIFLTEDIGVPKGYYTPGSIVVRGTANIQNVSLFALGNVEIQGGAQITGEDLAYKNWYNPPFNTTARPVTIAGAGAVGSVTYTGGATSMIGTRDFDGPDAENDGFEFIRKDPPEGSQSTSEISFPFDYALPDTDFLRDIAKANGTYYEVSGGTTSVSSWPAGSDSSTVVFYKFTSTSANTLKWDVPGDCTDDPADPDDIKQGTLVVENGNFTTQPNKALFRGAVVVRGGEVADGTSDDTGRTCLEGFINAEGNVKIAGNVTPMSSEEVGNRPGFYGVRTWSWRELYE